MRGTEAAEGAEHAPVGAGVVGQAHDDRGRGDLGEVAEEGGRTAGEVLGEVDDQVAHVVKLANWTDERRTTLAPHPPEPTPTVVEIGEDDETEED